MRSKSTSLDRFKEFDERKLSAFTDKSDDCHNPTSYCYDYGFLIEFDLSVPNCSIEIFENGKKLEDNIKFPWLSLSGISPKMTN